MTSSGHNRHSRPSTPGTEATLQPAGVTEFEERVYRRLVRHPQATLTQLAAWVGRGTDATRRALDGLETAGLVSRQGKPSRFIPAAPDMAVEALIMRRQEELERCRIAAANLLIEYREAARDLGHVVELIDGTEASEQRYLQILGTARAEVFMFDKPPYLGSGDNPLELEILARGVSWRAVYAPEAFELPGRLEQVRGWQAAGEQARVGADVPLKLVLVDRRVALLPLIANDPTTDRHTAILVHPSSLLTTLGMLFDVLWERAIPLGSSAAGPEPVDELGKVDRALLQLLTAGVKDQAIARQLGLSLRTVRRRLAHLMTDAGVASRFQLGVLAAQRGWI